MKRVIILDLDNTLIYSTYDGGLKVNKLFKYMDFFEVYDEIVIVDDYPEIWDIKIHDRCRFIIPFGFMGDEKDYELKMLMEKQLNYTLCNL